MFFKKNRLPKEMRAMPLDGNDETSIKTYLNALFDAKCYPNALKDYGMDHIFSMNSPVYKAIVDENDMEKGERILSEMVGEKLNTEDECIKCFLLVDGFLQQIVTTYKPFHNECSAANREFFKDCMKNITKLNYEGKKRSKNVTAARLSELLDQNAFDFINRSYDYEKESLTKDAVVKHTVVTIKFCQMQTELYYQSIKISLMKFTVK